MEEGEHMPQGEKEKAPDGKDLSSPEKMDAAKNAPGDAEMKPLATNTKEIDHGTPVQESKEDLKARLV